MTWMSSFTGRNKPFSDEEKAFFAFIKAHKVKNRVGERILSSAGHLHDADLSGQSFEVKEFEGLKGNMIDFTGAVITAAPVAEGFSMANRLKKAAFPSADFSDAVFQVEKDHLEIENCDLMAAEFDGTRFSFVSLVLFSHCDLKGSTFKNIKLEPVDDRVGEHPLCFYDCDMTDADLSKMEPRHKILFNQCRTGGLLLPEAHLDKFAFSEGAGRIITAVDAQGNERDVKINSDGSIEGVVVAQDAAAADDAEKAKTRHNPAHDLIRQGPKF